MHPWEKVQFTYKQITNKTQKSSNPKIKQLNSQTTDQLMVIFSQPTFYILYYKKNLHSMNINGLCLSLSSTYGFNAHSSHLVRSFFCYRQKFLWIWQSIHNICKKKKKINFLSSSEAFKKSSFIRPSFYHCYINHGLQQHPSFLQWICLDWKHSSPEHLNTSGTWISLWSAKGVILIQVVYFGEQSIVTLSSSRLMSVEFDTRIRCPAWHTANNFAPWLFECWLTWDCREL